MDSSHETLVNVGYDGVVTPLGAEARKALTRLAKNGGLLLLSPDELIVVREAPGPDDDGQRSLWLTGEAKNPSRLLDIFNMVAHARWSGELNLTDFTTRRALWMIDGHVVGASSSHSNERLGNILRRFGILSPEQVEVVMGAVRANVRFGDAAVRLGFISRPTLFRYLKRQTEEIVYAALTMSTGTFTFHEGARAEALTMSVNIPMRQLVLEGARRIDEMSYFRQRVPSSQHIPCRLQAAAAPQPEQASAVFAAINGARTVEEVAAVAGLSTFDATRVIYELLGANKITLRAPRVAGLTGLVDAFNEALALIMGELAHYPAARERVQQELAAFTARKPVYSRLFRAAGPTEDGCMAPRQVLRNLLGTTNVTDPESLLGRWLYEYATYAMFTAEPILRAGSRTNAGAIANRVAQSLTPLSRGH